MNEETPIEPIAPDQSQGPSIQKNDWIRYYDQQGNLKIGCVNYIVQKENGVLFALENGIAAPGSVVEVRSESK